MKVPVVLPVLHVSVDEAGQAAVSLDGQPYGDSTAVRAAIPTLIKQLSTELATPVRVEILEADGSRYVDIALPDQPDGSTAVAQEEQVADSGSAFTPGEDVALAYVLSTRAADGDGLPQLGLPPALTANHYQHLLLIGMRSGAVMHLGATP